MRADIRFSCEWTSEGELKYLNRFIRQAAAGLRYQNRRLKKNVQSGRICASSRVAPQKDDYSASVPAFHYYAGTEAFRFSGK